MTTMRVLVLLLLASVHVFTPVSSDEQDESVIPAANQTQSAKPTTAKPMQATNETLAATTKTQSPTSAKAADPTPAPKDVQVTAATPNKATPTALAPATAKAAVLPTAQLSADKTLDTGTPEPPVGPTEKTNKTMNVPSSDASDSTNSSSTLQPRSPNPGEQAETLPGAETTKTNETRGPDESTEKPNEGTVTNTVFTGAASPSPAPPAAPPMQPKDNAKGAGPQTGTNEKEPAKSDKKLWWILLPVGLVAAAAAIVLKFKFKKIHDHTETIDTGTENASFQSRPESSKDGVMLLGVKSSGGEENAAAR
ncbi:uncharacterized protein [Pagrus major]|uniref:uncharacterized protein n=1 Tax=Pagrus major TaxID=143350 RepID=UPI003CC88FBA